MENNCSSHHKPNSVLVCISVSLGKNILPDFSCCVNENNWKSVETAENMLQREELNLISTLLVLISKELPLGIICMFGLHWFGWHGAAACDIPWQPKKKIPVEASINTVGLNSHRVSSPCCQTLSGVMTKYDQGHPVTNKPQGIAQSHPALLVNPLSFC